MCLLPGFLGWRCSGDSRTSLTSTRCCRDRDAYRGTHPHQEGTGTAAGTSLTAWTSHGTARSPVPPETSAPQPWCRGARPPPGWVRCVGRISRRGSVTLQPAAQKKADCPVPGVRQEVGRGSSLAPGAGEALQRESIPGISSPSPRALPLVRSAAGSKSRCKCEGTERRGHRGGGINPAKVSGVKLAACLLPPLVLCMDLPAGGLPQPARGQWHVP